MYQARHLNIYLALFCKRSNVLKRISQRDPESLKVILEVIGRGPVIYCFRGQTDNVLGFTFTTMVKDPESQSQLIYR